MVITRKVQKRKYTSLITTKNTGMMVIKTRQGLRRFIAKDNVLFQQLRSNRQKATLLISAFSGRQYIHDFEADVMCIDSDISKHKFAFSLMK